MSVVMLLFYLAVLASRAVALAISIRHERALRSRGAVEFGVPVSSGIVVAFLLLFFGSVTESILYPTNLDWISFMSIGIWCGSLATLVAVIRSLKGLWTMKILIVPDHVLVDTWLFRHMRHPNYYLNMIPEALAICLIGHSYITLFVALPVYLVLIGLRIREEERVMKRSGLWHPQ